MVSQKTSGHELPDGGLLAKVKLSESRYADSELAHKIERLRLERLANREIVDKLVEAGYQRDTVIEVLRDLLKQREISSDYTSPLIFMLVTALMVVWGLMPTTHADPIWLGPLKIFVTVVGMMVSVPSAAAFLYKTYDHIPGVRTVLEPVMARWRTRQADIMALDLRFLGNEIRDREYEDCLVALTGKYRGKRHFRRMRNQKHFGLE
jgi:hypothetical protein